MKSTVLRALLAISSLYAVGSVLALAAPARLPAQGVDCKLTGNTRCQGLTCVPHGNHYDCYVMYLTVFYT